MFLSDQEIEALKKCSASPVRFAHPLNLDQLAPYLALSRKGLVLDYQTDRFGSLCVVFEISDSGREALKQSQQVSQAHSDKRRNNQFHAVIAVLTILLGVATLIVTLFGEEVRNGLAGLMP